MDVLQQRVRQARRRLTLQRLVTLLPWCWFGTLLVAATVIGVDRFYPLGLDPTLIVGGAIGLGLLAAIGWVWITRRSTLDAALEIDRRCGLKERISTALALSPTELESPAGRAMMTDTLRHLERVSVGDEFAISLSRRAWVPLVPAAVAFALAMFLAPAVGKNQAEAVAQKQAAKKQVENTADTLRKKLAERQKEAREKGLKDAEDLLALLEQQTEKLQRSNDSDQKQALVKLNDMAKNLEDRKKQLGGGDSMRAQFEQLKQLQKGPADKLADAMQRGDLQQAVKELDKLRQELDKKNLDPQAKEQLAKQLDQLGQKLQDLAQAEQKMQEQLQEQVAQQRAAGQNAQANDLEQQLAKLQQQAGQQAAMDKLAKQLAQAAKALQQGDGQQAAKDLQNLQQQMNQLQQQMAEAKLLENALDQIAQAKQNMKCGDCQGQGCKQCNGGGKQGGNGQQPGKDGGQGGGPPQLAGDKLDGPAGMGQDANSQPGNGIGNQRGQNISRDHDLKDGAYDSRVGQQVGKGQARITGMVRGPNVKGQVSQEIQSEFESVKGGATDPLTDQQLSRGQRDHAKEYFDGLRDGN